MSKYIKKARSIARETSHQIHNVRDDITKKQLQKERDKIPAHSRVNNATYKFSDIGKWLDKDLDDEDDDFFSSLNSQTSSDSQEQLDSDNDHPQGSSLQSSSASLPPPPPPSIFDDDLFGEMTSVDQTTSGDPLGLTDSKSDDLFPDDDDDDDVKQQGEDLVRKVKETASSQQQEATLNSLQERETQNENGDTVKDITAATLSVVQGSENRELPIMEELATTDDCKVVDGDRNEEMEECGLLNKYSPNKSNEETQQAFHSSSSHNAVTDTHQSNNDDDDDDDGVTNDDKSTTAAQQDEETLIEDDRLDTSSSTKCEEEDELFKSFTSPMAAAKLQQEEEEEKERGHLEDDDELFKSFSLAEADKLHEETKDERTAHNDNNDSKPLESSALEMTEDHPLMHVSDEYDDLYTSTATPITIPPSSLTPPMTSLSPLPNSHPPPPLTNSSPENATSWSPSGSKRPRPVVPPRPVMTNRYSVESSTGGVFSSDSEANRSLEFVVQNKRQKRGGLPPVGVTSKEVVIPPPPAGESTAPLSLSLGTFVLYLYYTLNPFVYLAGFLAGFLLFYVVFGSAFVLYVQYSEKEKERRAASKNIKDRLETLPSLDQLPGTIEIDFEKKRELKSNSFGLVHQYHPSTHHPSQRHITRVRLYEDFHLELRYRKLIQTLHDGPVTRNDIIKKDLRECSILLVPEEVALNRKRRWSKKFPICVQWPDDRKEGHVFLFTSTSHEKEEWFRRLRAASENKSYDELVKDCSEFYRYMGCYMPEGMSQSPLPTRARQQSQSQSLQSTASKNQRKGRQGHHPHGGSISSNKTGGAGAVSKTESVHFTMSADSEQDDADDSILAVNITQRNQSTSSASITSTTGTSSISSQRNGYSRPSSGDQSSPSLLPLSLSMGWINAGMARLAWDLWHEERWKNWVTSRIQRKLIRIKTPSFLEELKVTEVTMGMDMPVIRKPFRLPKLNQNGIWIYLEVTYNGSFTMTIETKLKLGLRGANPESVQLHQFNQFPSLGEGAGYHHKRMRRHRVGGEAEEEEEEEISSGSDEEGEEDEDRSSSYSQSMEEKDIEPQQQTGVPPPGTTDITSGPPGRKEKILNNMVSRLQKIAAKSRIVAKAAEKVSSYPLVLTVEVKRLDGLLVLNMAPPPSDAIWYGFAENPKLELVATPKLGQREVTLSYVTDWIEKKLCEVVEKKLVMPNMEDIVVPVLSSGLQEDMMMKDKISS